MSKQNANQSSDPNLRKRRVKQLQIVEEPSFMLALVNYVKTHLLGQVLALIVLAIVIVLANVVIAGDSFDTFFMLIGIEITLLLLILWIFYLLAARKNPEEENN